MEQVISRSQTNVLSYKKESLKTVTVMLRLRVRVDDPAAFVSVVLCGRPIRRMTAVDQLSTRRDADEESLEEQHEPHPRTGKIIDAK